MDHIEGSIQYLREVTMLKVIYNNLHDYQHPKILMKSWPCGPCGESCTKCTNVITHTLVITSGQTRWHWLQMNWPDNFESMKIISLPTWACVSAVDKLTKKISEQAEEQLGHLLTLQPRPQLWRVSLGLFKRKGTSVAHQVWSCGSSCVTMRKWDGKPTWRLETWRQELKGK